MGKPRGLNAAHIEDVVAIISLSQGKQTTVDIDDLERILRTGKWFAQKSTTPPQRDYYARSYVGGLLSRFVLCAPVGVYVDHRDHNTLNNRKDNIRICDPINSARNRVKQSSNTSGLIGVCWHNLVGKWQARITVGGERVLVGWFEDKEEAGRARDIAAKEAYGDCVVLNFTNY